MASVHVNPPLAKCALPAVYRLCCCGSNAIARYGGQSSINDRHRPRPAGGPATDLHRKAAHCEARGRQSLEIVQLLDMAIADLAPGPVTLPDQLGVMGLGIFLLGVDE